MPPLPFNSSWLDCFHVLLFLTFSRSKRKITIHNGAVIIPATVKNEKKQLYNTCFILSSFRVGNKILYLQELITQINPGLATSSPITVVFSGPVLPDVSTSARFVPLTLHCVKSIQFNLYFLFIFFWCVL